MIIYILTLAVVRRSRVTMTSLEEGTGEALLVGTTAKPRELVVGATSVLLAEVIVVAATVITAEVAKWRLVTCMYT